MKRGKALAPINVVSAVIAYCPDFGAKVDIDTDNVRESCDGMWMVPLTGLDKNGITAEMFVCVESMCGNSSKLVVPPGGQPYVLTPGYVSRHTRSQSPAPRPVGEFSTSRKIAAFCVRCVIMYIMWTLISSLVLTVACKHLLHDMWVASTMCGAWVQMWETLTTALTTTLTKTVTRLPNLTSWSAQ